MATIPYHADRPAFQSGGPVLLCDMTLGEVPTGVVADQFGRKTSLIIGAFLSTTGSLAYGLAPTASFLILANIVWAVALTGPGHIKCPIFGKT